MDTRFLESLLVVAELGSMAAAARRLGITPAAVAQRIRALEQEVGAPLIARAGRTVMPTEAGNAILAQGRAVVRAVQEMRMLAAGDALTGDLRIGAVSTALTGLLPAMLKRFVEKAPSVALYIVPGTSDELYRRVTDGDLDAALVVRPQFALPKACDWLNVRAEPLIVLVPKGMKRRAPHDVLRSEPFIRYDRNQWGGRFADMYLRQVGIRPKEWLELDALDAIAIMVSEGFGISLVPDWAPPWPAGISVKKIPLPASAHSRHLGMIWMRSSPRLHIVAALLSAARSTAAR